MKKNIITSIIFASFMSVGLSGCVTLWGSDSSSDQVINNETLQVKSTQDSFVEVLPNFEILDPIYALGSDGDFDKGLEAYSEKLYGQALLELYPLAKEKEPNAEYYLALMYLNGLGLPLDFKQGAIWLQRSANHGNINAQYELGQMYIAGQQIEQNYDQGIRWLLSAAQQNHAGAQFSFGLLYQQDKVPLSSDLMAVYKQTRSELFNFKQAAKWYTLAAEQNYGPAQNNLAWLYLLGQAGEQSDALAFKWYTQAANEGVIDAQYNLALLFEQGKGTTLDLQEALFWHSKAADQGYLPSQQRLPFLQQQITSFDTSLVLYGAVLSASTRPALRERIKNNKGLALREADGFWFDAYESSQLLPNTDRLFVGYSLQTGNVGSLEYRFPSFNDPNYVLEVINMISKKYGQPIDRQGDLNNGALQYKWEEKDTVITVSRYLPDTTVYLSYHIGNSYQQMISEMPKNAEKLKYNIEFETY